MDTNNWQEKYKYIGDDELSRNFIFSQNLNNVLGVAFCIYQINTECYIENSGFKDNNYDDNYILEKLKIMPFLQFILKKENDICDFPKSVHSRVIPKMDENLENNIVVGGGGDDDSDSDDSDDDTITPVNKLAENYNDTENEESMTEQNAFETECFLKFVEILEEYFKIKNLDEIIRTNKIVITDLYKGFIEYDNNNIVAIFDSTTIFNILNQQKQQNIISANLQTEEQTIDIAPKPPSNNNIVSGASGGGFFDTLNSMIFSTTQTSQQESPQTSPTEDINEPRDETEEKLINNSQENNSAEYYLAIIDEIVFNKRIYSFSISNFVVDFFNKNNNLKYIRNIKDNSNVQIPLLMYLLNEPDAGADADGIGIYNNLKYGIPIVESFNYENKMVDNIDSANLEDNSAENINGVGVGDGEKIMEESSTNQNEKEEDSVVDNVSINNSADLNTESQQEKDNVVAEDDATTLDLKTEPEPENVVLEDMGENTDTTTASADLNTEPETEPKPEPEHEPEPEPEPEPKNVVVEENTTINSTEKKIGGVNININGINITTSNDFANKNKLSTLTPVLINDNYNINTPYNYYKYGYMYYFTQDYKESIPEYRRYCCFINKCFYDVNNEIESAETFEYKNKILFASTIYFHEDGDSDDKVYWGIKNVLQFTKI